MLPQPGRKIPGLPIEPKTESPEPAAGGESSTGETGPGPAKRQRTDPVLEFLEAEAVRAEERARREEEREERLLSLLEKIVKKNVNM